MNTDTQARHTRRQALAPVIAALLLVLFGGRSARAQVFGSVRVTVHDAQNLTISNAAVSLKAQSSTWTQMAPTSADGTAPFPAVPVGQYVVSVTFEGFSPAERTIAVMSNVTTPIGVQLSLAEVTESLEVTGAVQTVNPASTRT